VPGSAIGILRDGAVTTAYDGVADVRTGEPVTPETLFSLGSLTKSMVATVIARLAAAGRLSLDDPVAAHVALTLDERTFLVDAVDPDNPTVTFGACDAAGRPRLLYLMLWGLPRIDQ
jgi:CubicO group peptidase (beta-lactamase class C family)